MAKEASRDLERQEPQNTLKCVSSAMKRAQKDDNKRATEVEAVEVPYGAIAVKTEIRWSVTQRYDYDYRVY